MIEGIIFDMDGLMFDTEKVALKVWQRIAREQGYEMSDAFVIGMLGRKHEEITEDIKREISPDFDTDLGWKLRTDYVTEWIDEEGVPLKEGLLELLAYAKANGIKMGIASSTHDKVVAEYLIKAGIDEYFDGIASGYMVENGKPAPDIFLLAAKQIGVAPERCLGLEDAPSGIRAASGAGMKVIMVPDLLKPTKEDLNFVDQVATTLADVIVCLQDC
ncbi:MAG: HAD family phosphatase [Lachnospiraceae bacterium]|nr:HAD family phosphatase [Lachnospiraceae bacterium]